jgi:hypothetical protein
METEHRKILQEFALQITMLKANTNSFQPLLTDFASGARNYSSASGSSHGTLFCPSISSYCKQKCKKKKKTSVA